MEDKHKQDLLSAIENDMILLPIVNDIFEKNDKNKDGLLERKELSRCMKIIARRLGANKPDQDAVEAEFQKLDANGDDVVDKNEFKKLVRATMRKVCEQL